MKHETKGIQNKLVIDLDDTISVTENGDYVNSKPIKKTVEMIKQYVLQISFSFY